MDEMPRSWIDMPPPGAPAFCVITAPTTLPLSAPSSVEGVVVPMMRLAESVVTALARFSRFTDVAKPVTTTSLSCWALSCSTMLSCAGAVTGRRCDT